jgi:hypothetical protein
MARRFIPAWRTDLKIIIGVLTAVVVLCLVARWFARNTRFGWANTLGTLVFTGLVLAALGLLLLFRSHRSDILERTSKLATIVAFLGAGAYFALQVASGELSSDLVVSVDTKRGVAADAPGQHYLAILVRLKHHRHNSFSMRNAVAFVRPENGRSFMVPLLDRYYRRSVRNELTGRAILDDRIIVKGRPERPTLTAGDEIQLAAYTKVPAAVPVIIDVVIDGRPHLISVEREQWVSSVVSLPVTDDGEMPNP